MTVKKSFIQNFAETKPSYMSPDAATDTNTYGASSSSLSKLEDTTTDPLFNVTSKIPYKSAITTRSTVWDYYRTSLLQPQYSEVLVNLGKNIEEIDQLLTDGRVKSAFNNRRSGTLSLKWTIDQNSAPKRMFYLCQKIFDQFDVYEVISEMLLAGFYGYSVSEVNWEEKDGLWIPVAVEGKAQRWYGWDELNRLRYKTKMNQVQGEPLPPRKFLCTRYHPTYADPAASREALFNGCYWPVKFRHMILEYGIGFVEKYGSPWLDVEMEAGLQQERLQEILDVLQQTFGQGIVAHPDSTKVTPMSIGDTKNIQIYSDWLDVMNREIDLVLLGNNMSSEIKGGSYAAATALMGVRDDIIGEDKHMIETTMNQLIEWICWYNFPSTAKLPKFKLYKSEPPTKDRAEIDVMLSKMGIKFKKSYFERTYGINDDEFEVGAPVQDISTGSKGDVAGAVPTISDPLVDPNTVSNPSTGEENQLSDKDSETVTEAGIETKDVSSNIETEAGIEKAQRAGSY